MPTPSLATLYAQACRERSKDEVVHAVGSDFEQELEAYELDLPSGTEINYRPEAGRFVLQHPEHELDGALQSVLNLSAERTLQKLLPAPRSIPAPTAGEADNSNRLLTWLMRGTFFAFNGVLGFVFVWWLIRLLTSPDYRTWYTTELLSADGGLVVYILTFLLVLTPLVSFGMGVLTLLRGLPRPSLARLFFLFELPALVVIFAGEVVLRNVPMTTGLRYVFAGLLVIAIVTWWQQIMRHQPSGPIGRLAWLTQTSFLFVGSLYLFLLVVVPTYLWGAVEVLSELPRVIEDLLLNPGMIFLALFYLGLALLPLIAASIGMYKVVRAYLGACRFARPILGGFTGAWVSGVAIVFLLALVVCSRPHTLSPYEEPLILLSQEDGGYAGLAARAEPLIGEKEAVDRKLEQALQRERNFLFRSSEFPDPGDSAWLLESYVLTLGFPFVDRSDPNVQLDSPELRRGYQRAFGSELPRSSRDFSLVERKQVQHESRDISVLSQNPDYFAEVTITDSFSTFLPQDQEVVLEFTLPEHAVITDLKLGPNLQHQGQVAPRGAAQQLYTEEVRQRIDPALLEQVGPRQYRLRVYPVPGTTDRAAQLRREEVKGQTQRVQYTYVTMREAAGIPLPIYTKTFNLLDGELEERITVQGQPKEKTRDGRFVSDPRSPEALCGLEEQITVPVSRDTVATLNLGAPARFTCVPGERVVQAYRGIDLDIAILIDTSYANHDGALEQQLAQLREFPDSFYAENTVSIHLFSDALADPYQISRRSEVPQTEDLVFFGRGNVRDALASVPAGADAVLVVAGETLSFQDVAVDAAPTPRPWGVRRGPAQPANIDSEPLENLSQSAVIFLHPPDAVPAYPIGVSELLSSARGGIFVSDDPLFTLSRAFTENRTGYEALYWDLQFATVDSGTSTPLAPALTGAPSLRDRQTFVQQLATRAFITNEQRRELRSGDSRNTDRFDELHFLASEVGIVTPLSSYLALVNERQQARLDELSGESDRYTSTQNFTVQQPSLSNPLSGGFAGGIGGGFMAQSTGLQSADVPNVPVVSRDGTRANPETSETSPNGAGTFLPVLIILLLLVVVTGGVGWSVLRQVKQAEASE